MNIDEQIVYLNNSVFVKLAPSKIHGVGVFAIRDIPQGTRFWKREGGIFNIPATEFNRLHSEIATLILDMQPQFKQGRDFWSPNDMAQMQCYMNHSDAPNSKQNIALRDIKIGEEITENYKDFGQPFHIMQVIHYNFVFNK